MVFVIRNPRDETGWSLSSQVKPIPERLRSLWYVRRLPQLGFAVLFGFLAVLPLFLSRRSQEFLWTEIVIYALVALSITPLAGWAGQLSLGQFAFVGLGALTMVMLRAGLDIPVPFDLWDMHVRDGVAAGRRSARRSSASSPRSSSASRRCAHGDCSWP